MNLAGWGRYPRAECDVDRMRSPEDARRSLAAHRSLIARGNGRSYGDASLNPAGVLSTLKSDRLIAFDPASGLITCEAGLILADLLEFSVPRGWFPPVTPGTKFVTIGGMIAADVHGKNHHNAGTFGRHVVSFELLTADGTVHVCSRNSEPELFAATLGGMGLTGIILTTSFHLIPIESASIRQETLRAGNFEEAMAICEASADWTYTVAWIDCLATGKQLGRSVVYRGEHARRNEAGALPLAVPARRKLGVPIDLPGFTLNAWTVRAFNEVYFRHGEPRTALVDYDSYFYPLDAIHDWNRIYGQRGFLQYQCAIPLASSQAALRQLLELVSRSGFGSFLAVLKRFGPEGEGMMSFPLEGYTLALDVPANPASIALLDELDIVTTAHGGRIYLAKDARVSADTIQRSYPKIDAFRALRHEIDPMSKFSSLLSQRVGL